jgi:hypothetical protein
MLLGRRRVEQTPIGHIDRTFVDISLCKLSLQQPCGTKDLALEIQFGDTMIVTISLCLWLVYVFFTSTCHASLFDNECLKLWIRQLNTFIHVLPKESAFVRCASSTFIARDNKEAIVLLVSPSKALAHIAFRRCQPWSLHLQYGMN